MKALQDITQNPCLPLTPEARMSFNHFFISTERWANLGKPFRYRGPLNFPLMIKEWPIVTDYLRKNKNFYLHLDKIMLVDLPQTIKDDCSKPDASNNYRSGSSPL